MVLQMSVKDHGVAGVSIVEIELRRTQDYVKVVFVVAVEMRVG
jgi:hypothetical protein